MASELGPSVVNGEIRYISPSQIEKFDEGVEGGCQRKWWFRYIAKVPDPRNAAAELGDQLHSQIERYSRVADIEGLGPIAKAGRQFIPTSHIAQETSFGQNLNGCVVSPLRAGVIPVIGRIDGINTGDSYIDERGEVTKFNIPTVEVIDWKTTGYVLDQTDPLTGEVKRKSYAKTNAQVGATWQMTAYGQVVRNIYDPDMIRLSHVYFQTKGRPLSIKRTALLAATEVSNRWERSAEIAEKMSAAAKLKVIREVPANLKACSTFGGCKYKSDCPRDARAVFGNLLKGGNRMGLLDSRRQQAPQTEAKTPAEPKEAPPSTPTAKAPADPMPAGRCPMAGIQRTLSHDEVDGGVHFCVCKAELKVKPVKMPDDTYRAVVPEHETGVTPVKAAAKPKTKKEKTPVSKEVTETDEPASIKFVGDGYSIYVDGLKNGVNAKPLSHYVAELATDLATNFGVPDIRIAGGDSALGFGRWKGALAAAARENPPVGAYYVRSGDEIGDVVWQALEAGAAEFFRGVR